MICDTSGSYITKTDSITSCFLRLPWRTASGKASARNAALPRCRG